MSDRDFFESNAEEFKFFSKLKEHLSPDKFSGNEINWCQSKVDECASSFRGNFYIHFTPKADIDFSDKKVARKFVKTLEDIKIKVRKPQSRYSRHDKTITCGFHKVNAKGERIQEYDDDFDNPNHKIVTTPLRTDRGYHSEPSYYVADNGHSFDCTPEDNFNYTANTIEINHGFRNYTDTGLQVWSKSPKGVGTDEIKFLVYDNYTKNHYLCGLDIEEQVKAQWNEILDEVYVKDVILKYFDVDKVWFSDAYQTDFEGYKELEVKS